MSILAECPQCHKKQSVRYRLCSCGEDLVRAKKAKRLRYWIKYRLPGGKQRKEFVGFSIEEARDAEGKRRSQKRENRIFEMLPETKATFQELSGWYLKLEKVKSLAYYDILASLLEKFNSEFGDVVVNKIKPADLENYQAKLKASGLSDSYIDQVIGAPKGMINKAFDNDLLGGDAIKSFRKVKDLLKRNSNARKRILTPSEFQKLMEALSKSSRSRHLKAIVATAYYTGMRKGEIISLTWDKVDLKNKVIRLEAVDRKDREAREIPICNELAQVILALPSRLQSSKKNRQVFQYGGEGVNDIRAGLKRACKDAGIDYGRKENLGFTFHDLRHTFNTNMRRAGVPESVIMAITGHATREMFDRYDTVDGNDKSAAIQKFMKHLQESTATEAPEQDQLGDHLGTT